ncbi:MAG: hypothetical protein IPK13_23415 [Deltaproteobacteria bacterium]|nr:hypothetical protein [Deltaproteobacteria bacterium]
MTSSAASVGLSLNIFFAAALWCPSTAHAAEPEAYATSLPVSFVDRPLTLPREVFDVGLSLSGTQWTDSAQLWFVGAEALYGLDDDLEIGLRLLRAEISRAPGTGLDSPTGLVALRYFKGRFVELSAAAEVEIPFDPNADLWGRLPALLRPWPWLRVDFTPSLHARTARRWMWSLGTPTALSFQLSTAFRVFGLAAFTVPDVRAFDALLFVPGAGFGYVFERRGAPSAELILRCTLGAHALVGHRPPDPNDGNHVRGEIALRLFYRDVSDLDTPLF